MEIGTEKIIEAYNGASTETVGVLNRMLGTDAPAVGFVKTFDEAVESLGSDHPVVRRYRRKGIMGFPKDYVLVGTQSEQKKYIGNAVEVNMSRRLCEALAEIL